MTDPLVTAPQAEIVRLRPSATERAWKFVEWHAEGGDCDCECWGHDEGEACTDECRQCSTCWATEIIVARNQEAADAIG